MSSHRRVIVVLGATGNQGGGVVRELLKSKSWIVRAGTRDPRSAKAQKLLTEEQTDDARLELVTIHPYDSKSLRNAFSGAHGVFAVTGEAHSDKQLISDEDMLHEIEAGRKIVQVARDCGIQHFVFSSLPDMMKTTAGRYPKLFHMNNKHSIESIAREQLPGKSTFIIPGFFYTNLHWQQYSRREENGVVRFCYPIPSDQPAQWTDPSYDMGVYTAKVFDLGIARTKDKTYLAMSPMITPQEMAEIFTRVTGQPATHSLTSFEEFGDLAALMVGPAFRDDAIQMMQWAAEAPRNKVAYGSQAPERDTSAEELAVSASTFEEWLKRSGWTGPSRE